LSETCIAFLKAQAEEINLDFQRIELIPGAESVVCMTWKGSKPEKTSIMLNSHMDVVPVDLVIDIIEYSTYQMHY